VILHLVAQSKRSRSSTVSSSVRTIEGAIAGVADQQTIGAARSARHPPLCLATSNGHPILTSETCALDISREVCRDVEPGEIVVFDEQGAHSHKRSRRSRRGPASSNTSTSRGRIPSSGPFGL